MTGLENISANNGWAIAALGVSIVFTGLTLLSLIIAQLHKILGFIDKSKQRRQRAREEAETPGPAEAEPDGGAKKWERLPQSDRESVRQFKMLSDRLKKPLSLPELLSMAQRVGMEAPHRRIDDLLVKKLIVPDGEGYFEWTL